MKKIKLIFLNLLIVTTLSFFGFSSYCYAAEVHNPTITMEVVSPNSDNQDWYLNVREKANENANIMGILRHGDTVEVIKTGAAWARIAKTSAIRDINTNEYKKITQYGYCSLKFLNQIYTPDYYTYRIISNAKVHSKPSSSSTIIKTIAKDTNVKVVGATPAWYKLSTGGYCLKKYFGKTLVVTGTTELNVRKGPGTKYEIDYTLKEFDSVTAISIKNGWAKLEDGNYSSAKYLLNGDKQVVSEILTDNLFYVTSTAEIRKGPGQSYALIGEIYPVQIEVTDIRPGGWYKIKNCGYVHKDNITMIYKNN